MTSGIDVFRGSEGVNLPPEVSREIWADMQSASIVQTLCRAVRMPGTGLSVPIITGDPEAEWVDETEEKPVSRPTFGSKLLKPHVLAVIVPFSRQFTRDAASLYTECRNRLPLALAKKFDRTALGYEPSPGDGFETLADVEEIDLEADPYSGALHALAEVVGSADGANVSAWALAPTGEIALLAARDDMGHPIFTPGASEGGSVGAVLGRPVYVTPHVALPEENVVGVAGDWQSAMWGYVEGIRIDVSAEASLKDTDGSTLNLWQRNMIGVRAEVEVAFAPRDSARFVRLTHSGTIPVRAAKRAAKKAATTEP